MNRPLSPRAYEINEQEVDLATFVHTACDPTRSVVVEACAGSGKTWLLVARMVRLLLAGVAPSELLAVTFTRKAAQEMQDRLMSLLREMALCSERELNNLLQERGVAVEDMPTMMPRARALFDRVLSHPHGLSIDTFHSWFGRLIQIAPLASGVPHGYTVTESSGMLLSQAYVVLMQSLNQPECQNIRDALWELYEYLGDATTRTLLDAFVDKRAEWWAAHRAGDPVQWLQNLCDVKGHIDARLSLWENAPLMKRIRDIAALLGQGTPTNQKRATAIERACSGAPEVERFEAVYQEFLGAHGEVRKNNTQGSRLKKILEDRFGTTGAVFFEEEFFAVGQVLNQIRRRSEEPRVLAINQALFLVGEAYLEHYQRIKSEQRVLDFSDLEWHVYSLLSDEDSAAYLHTRLDTRYKHILLDEFQDTNSLQWHIVRSWLQAYQGNDSSPSVFVVGDPKQSIYRFRRAEPKIFFAAQKMLAEQGAALLRANQTRRNAKAIVDSLNQSFLDNPLFQAQTTTVSSTGHVWKLPLVHQLDVDKEKEETFFIRDPLLIARSEKNDAHFEEGCLVAKTLMHLAQQIGYPTFKWSDVMVLVKRRTHLAAYERALREVGIPFISDKKGGLLNALEISDFMALLQFLMIPSDRLSLAHVLKSPLMGVQDSELVEWIHDSKEHDVHDVIGWEQLRSFWERKQGQVSEELARAVRLLTSWLSIASHLPVHDLLDRIVHEGDALARYAQVSPTGSRDQVVGNIHALLELSLSLEEGRYPSVSKLIESLRRVQQGRERDGPDEAHMSSSVDAVRIMTIHGAKGLEAPIVVLLDANHSASRSEAIGVLCDWPEEAMSPTHFSVFTHSDRGGARDALFETERQFTEQEDWNLFYVAMTRAQNIFIMSGVMNEKSGDEEGIARGSCYQRVQVAQEGSFFDEIKMNAIVHEDVFIVSEFSPPVVDRSMTYVQKESSEKSEGIAHHLLLERLTNHATNTWPIAVPNSFIVQRWLACSEEEAKIVQHQASVILSEPTLRRFFDADYFVSARNEWEIVYQSNILRMDRVVFFENEIWILDYKRHVMPRAHAEYRAQLEMYQLAMRQLFPKHSIQAAVVAADGMMIELELLSC